MLQFTVLVCKGLWHIRFLLGLGAYSCCKRKTSASSSICFSPLKNLKNNSSDYHRDSQLCKKQLMVNCHVDWCLFPDTESRQHGLQHDQRSISIFRYVCMHACVRVCVCVSVCERQEIRLQRLVYFTCALTHLSFSHKFFSIHLCTTGSNSRQRQFLPFSSSPWLLEADGPSPWCSLLSGSMTLIGLCKKDKKIDKAGSIILYYSLSLGRNNSLKTCFDKFYDL